MAKNKKRKGGSHSNGQHHEDNVVTKSSSNCKKEIPTAKKNPLLHIQQRFLQSLPKQVRSHFFSPTHVTPEQRAEIWEAQADIGEELVNTYAWATPDPRLLKVFQHFSPIIESKCHSIPCPLFGISHSPYHQLSFLLLIHRSLSIVSNMSSTWNSNSISS